MYAWLQSTSDCVFVLSISLRWLKNPTYHRRRIWEDRAPAAANSRLPSLDLGKSCKTEVIRLVMADRGAVIDNGWRRSLRLSSRSRLILHRTKTMLALCIASSGRTKTDARTTRRESRMSGIEPRCCACQREGCFARSTGSLRAASFAIGGASRLVLRQRHDYTLKTRL
jgi:hypothetical protein